MFPFIMASIIGLSYSTKALAFDGLTWAGQLAKGALYERCDHYLGFGSGSSGCRKRTLRLLEDMNPIYEFHGKKQIMVNYLRDLKDLLGQPQVLHYLEDLSSDQNHVLNLYDWTLKYTQGNKGEAIRWLAVLFQDDGLSMSHVQYLRLHLGSAFARQIEILSRAIEVVRLAPFDLFPPQFGDPAGTPALYHFYVIAYAAQLLRNSGAGDDGWFAPFLMNTNYEIIFHNCSPDGNPRPNFKCWNVKTVEIAPNLEWLDNVYLGYLGARFGNGLQFPLDRKSFIMRFAADIPGTIRQFAETDDTLSMESPLEGNSCL